MEEEIINWIRKKRNKSQPWDWATIRKANRESEEELAAFLMSKEEDDDWPHLTIEQWYDIVSSEIQKEEARNQLIDKQGASVIHAKNEQNDLKVPLAEDSAWQTYRRTLLHNGFPQSSIDDMEDATIKTLKNLSRNTKETGPVKGLVVGNVQSGKTANMTALMAMAADNGWNMFIILSGMMNNLKDQTTRRIISDLKGSNLAWIPIRDPRARSPYGEKVRDLDLREGSHSRYISVCIKNSARLKQLLDWLNYDRSAKEKVRLLIIDDEADQASINTSPEERTRINNLILNLVNNKKANGDTSSSAEAVNYVGYTATPYANVLNEGPGENSLYPKDFITTLSVSNEYFGPQQIFGYESSDDDTTFPGMDIVRNVPDSERVDIEDIHNGVSATLPESLINSICWFLCGVASMRYTGYKKPVSMLVHTSRNKEDHRKMQQAISGWFSATSSDKKLQICRQLWETESTRFNSERLISSYPGYARKHEIENGELPSFEQILPELTSLLQIGLQNILINDDKQLKYSSGIHICVDNSDKSDDKKVNLRLLYPEENQMPKNAPAFLVIGGNTLSRGLTLEGLISTFFLRPAHCADTLMQMGRWFGYRKGYELLPRIWMPQDIKDQFIFMAEMDQRLRNEIRQMAASGVSPADCGPKIMASPSTKFLQIVSDNKQQSAIPATYDFSGTTKETSVFNNNIEELEYNLALTKEFVLALGQPSPSMKTGNTVWRDVSWDIIRDFLMRYKHSRRLKNYDELTPFLEWLDKKISDNTFGKWNVILAGLTNGSDEKRWMVSNQVSVIKVSHAKITPDRADGALNIKSLRSFDDYLSDISNGDAQSRDRINYLKRTHNMLELNKLRTELGLGTTPQLVIYIIDKDSQPRNTDSTTRFPLNAARDIAAYSINIPGYRTNRSNIATITCAMPR